MISVHDERREEIRRVYIRVCRDSRFRMPMDQAAKFTSKMLDLGGNGGVDGAILVWTVLGIDTMERIANGSHECLNEVGDST